MYENELFPITSFSQRVQESLLEAFGGHCPSTSEVAQLSDSFLLTLLGFGPKTLQKVRALTFAGIKLSKITPDNAGTQLQVEVDRLGRDIAALQYESEHRQRELQCRIYRISSEFLVQETSLKPRAQGCRSLHLDQAPLDIVEFERRL